MITKSIDLEAKVTTANDDINSVTRIDLLPEEKTVCFILKGLFSHNFCQQLKNKAMARGFCSANDKYPTSYRNNQRLVEDNKTLAQHLYLTCKPHIPNQLNLNNMSLSIDSLNERLRYCKYAKQQAFSIHRDGVFYKNDNQQSVFTFLLYLNSHNDFVGGETTFYKDQHGNKVLASYKPDIGDVAVFDHRIWHSGNEVHKGSKYILRSDFIYSVKALPASADSEKTQKHHDGYIWKVINIDSQLSASASRDKTIKIWDDNINCIQSLKKHQNSVFDLTVDEHKNLYAVSRDGYMTKWKKHNNQYDLDFRVNTFHPSALKVLSLPNSAILTSGSDGSIRLWENNRQVASYNKHKGWVWSLASLDKNTFISCDSMGEIIIWDINTQKIIVNTRDKGRSFRCMAIYENSLFLGDEKGQITQLNAYTLEYKRHWQIHGAIVRDIVATKNGLISCGEDNKVLYTDYSGEQTELLTHDDFATSLSLTKSGRLLSSSYAGTIKSIQIE